jgi:hypothetical protein
MTRTLSLALAAALIAAPAAFAADISPTQVRLDGRTQSQIRADIQTVAARLCKAKVAVGDTAALDDCISEAVRLTMKKVMARGDYVWTTASADD